MSTTRVRPSGWTLGENLTSAECTQIDINASCGLDKRTGQTDTLASDVDVNGTIELVSGGLLKINPEADCQVIMTQADCYITIGNDARLNIANGKCVVSSSGVIEINTQDAIQLNAQRSIKSQFDGSIQLGSTTDNIVYEDTRTKKVMFFFPTSGVYTGSNGLDGWSNNGRYASSLALATSVTIEFIPPEGARGSVLGVVGCYYSNSSIHSPGTPAKLNAYRVDRYGTEESLSSASFASMSYATTSPQEVSLTCNAAGIGLVNQSDYRYKIKISEESGAGASFGNTQIFGFYAEYYQITELRS